ncbi:MAG: outer membrane protein assembly factor BamA [Gemmataceae bacterium]|nr:outer membrane protein assembly factor BamA [Gemmataceae bacterium]
MKATDRFHRSPRRLAAAVLVVLLAGAAACYAQSASGPPIVDDVIVPMPANALISSARVTNVIKTKPGNPYNQATADEDVRELYATKAFANVQVRLQDAGGNRVKVYFLLTALPSTVQEILYDGAKHLSNDDLETLTGIRKGLPLNPIANQAACSAIEKKYQEKGRMFARVELIEGGKMGDTRVVYRITEGPAVRVNSIQFTGNSFVSGGRLRTQINSSRAFLGLPLGGDFNPAMADNDVSILEKYYKTFGFQDVAVSRELQWDADHRFVTLVFHIHEGQRYRVKGVDLTGYKTYDQDKLLTLVRTKPGEFYDRNVVQADVSTFKDYYGYGGRDVIVKEELSWPKQGDAPGEVGVHYEITERQPATVGQIFVVGNDVTRQNVILRQVPLYPGQVLTYPDIRRGEANLSRLNIFEANAGKGIRPTIEVLDPESENPVKDVLVSVEEARTGSLMFGLGVNSDAGLTGSIVLNERNFDILRPPTSLEDLLSGRAWRGGGQEFRLEAVPGLYLQRYTASWREPYLFDSAFSLGVSGYYYDRAFNEYTESRYGTRITLGRRLNEYWSLVGSTRVENVGVRNIPYFAPPQITDDQGDTFLLGFRGGLSRDTRDSYMRPTSGSIVEMGYEQILGSFTYPLVTIEGSKYFTVYQRADGSGRHVVALRSQASWTNSNAPVYERFYAGGFRSIRGFEFRGVGPVVNGYEVGGDFMWLNSVEYQLPVLANDQLYFVAFVDSGTVEAKTEITNYRVTAGVGARVTVPMMGPVPIALDFGFPIVQAAQDRKQVFSFWLGFFR